MQEQLIIQAKAVITELTEKSKLKTGDIVVIGCSTSEIIGSGSGPIPVRILPKWFLKPYTRLHRKKVCTFQLSAVSKGGSTASA